MTTAASDAGKLHAIEHARRGYVDALRRYADDLQRIADQARAAAILAEPCSIQPDRLAYALGVLDARIELAGKLGPVPSIHPRDEDGQ